MALLKQSHAASGFPLVVAGLGLMLFGWRLWKLCVMLSFGAIGAAVTALAVGPSESQWIYALVGGGVLGLVSYWPVNFAVCVLGGLIGSVLCVMATGGFHLSPSVSTGVAVGGFVVFAAFSFLNRQKVVIVVTSLLGAVLLMLGITVWVMALPGFYGSLNAMVSSTSFILPFAILVPTVMSCFYQVADLRRTNVSL